MTENEILYRSQICNDCEFKIGEVTLTCDLCACPITYLISSISSTCPKNKWQYDSQITTG